MKIKSLCLLVFVAITIRVYPHKFGTVSGNIRFGGGIFGVVSSVCMPITVGLLQMLKFTDFDLQKWSNEQHNSFRFFNISGDLWCLDWSMTASNEKIELHRPFESWQGGGLLDSDKIVYTSNVGYCLNWMPTFSSFGFWGGIDYEWRNFMILKGYNYVGHNIWELSSSSYSSYNKIQSIVPTIGIRYRLIGPMKEVAGVFPFNIVFEVGISYVINVKYENADNYSIDALNNGFRPVIGIAVTTKRYGSMHLRWTKDWYNLFNKDYKAMDGFLYNNEISNNFRCISIGYAIFI